MLHIITVLLCFVLSFTLSPPILNYSYEVSFIESVIRNKQTYHIRGQQFYDPINNRQRVDRQTGIHNIFCGSILPGVNTSCQALTVGGNRWLIFPQRSQCCLCCTSAHGCGILRPDWLKDSEYQGEHVIDGANYQKWHLKGQFSDDDLYTTNDSEQLPRRLEEGPGQITDYDLANFAKKTLADSVFAIPAYCNPSKPANCPLASTCGALRGQSLALARQN